MEDYSEEEPLENNDNKRRMLRIFLFISIFVVLIVIGIIVAKLFLEIPSENNQENVGFNNGSEILEFKEDSEDLSQIGEDDLNINDIILRTCLQENSFSEECLSILQNDEDICEQMDNLKDNCYYESALINSNINSNESYCFKIKNESMRGDCRNDTILLNPENEPEIFIPEDGGMPS